MTKRIWFLWLQGWDNAPDLVKICYQSWVEKNPDWTVTFIDASSIYEYLPDRQLLEILEHSQITAASFSDLLRLQLLAEYGGVWSDATTLCTQSLDSWLNSCVSSGYFMFQRPARDRTVATWFIAAEEGHWFVRRYADKALKYWSETTKAQDYFWVHYLLRDLLLEDEEMRDFWGRQVVKKTADAPHALQKALNKVVIDKQNVHRLVEASPVHKLNHRSLNISKHLLSFFEIRDFCPQKDRALSNDPQKLSMFSLSTNNVGDHIQAIALRRLYEIAGLSPRYIADRDTGLASVDEPCSMVIAGWFKHGKTDWPPSAMIRSYFVSFHMRVHQCPLLISDEAINYYQSREPIYCRDPHTAQTLLDKGVDARVSHCFTLTFPRRLREPEQPKTFIVSRDKQILNFLPETIDDYNYVCHYSNTKKHADNVKIGLSLLDRYRDEAGLVVTTLLHCALPCIAMGIPIIMCWPASNEKGHTSDMERLSSLSELIEIHNLEDLQKGHIESTVIKSAEKKLQLRKLFHQVIRENDQANVLDINLIAEGDLLPPPTIKQIPDGAIVAETRLRRLLDTGIDSDPVRWGNKESYVANWASRGELAAKFLPNDVNVLELGAGTGTFETLVASRVNYQGADLMPIFDHYLKLDLNKDSIPHKGWDYIVALGVLEYLTDIQDVVGKLSVVAPNIIVSYCCASNLSKNSLDFRKSKDWINNLTEEGFKELFGNLGYECSAETLCNKTEYLAQKVFHFTKKLPS